MAWKLGDDSSSVAEVFFVDGNVTTFYSRDWIHKYSKHRDRQLGLRRLENMIIKFGARVDNASIFDISTRSELQRCIDGALITPNNPRIWRKWELS